MRVPGHATGLSCIDIDLAQRRHAEMVREKYHAQFAQSQKMESVGRLTGGACASHLVQ